MNLPTYKGLQIKKSRNGLGIFTTQTFKNGAILFPIQGKRVHYTVLLKHPGPMQNNAFRYGPETYISPGGQLADFQNHSCKPNAKVVKRNRKLFVVSIRPLHKDEEVLIDYSTITAADDIWTMRCNCGSKQCRQKIARYTKLPKTILEQYIKEKIISPHILSL